MPHAKASICRAVKATRADQSPDCRARSGLPGPPRFRARGISGAGSPRGNPAARRRSGRSCVDRMLHCRACSLARLGWLTVH